MAVLKFFLVASLSFSGFSYAQTVSTVPKASKKVLGDALDFSSGYGIHEPNGLDAVQYLYSPEGTWRAFTGLKNIYGYYNVSDAELAALIAYANGTNPATCQDPDLNVLFDLPYDSETASGRAFEEHNGRGVNGTQEGTPFSQFWFDDNYLARYMSEAYGAPVPQGLYVSPTRWQIIGLDAGTWPYPDGSAPDQDALKGLFYIATGNLTMALQEWQGVYSQAGSDWDPVNLRYSYPGLDQEYYLGLFKILTDRLMDAGVSAANQSMLFQHSISLRSNILAGQQYEDGSPIGWCTDRFDNTSLINTETTSCQVLGLGTGARYSYEAGQGPLTNPSGFVVQPYNALSAIKGESTPGPMIFGPHATLPLGTYTVDWYMRSAKPGKKLVVNLQVHEVLTDTFLGSLNVTASQFPADDQWGRYSVDFTITDTSNQLEYLVNWGGQADLDVSTIRVR